MAQPGRLEKSLAALEQVRGDCWRGKKRPEVSERMKRNNPMSDPAVREKANQAKRGRTFLSRGGNGQPTVPQLRLAAKLGLPVEYPIPTKPVKGQFPSLPNCYKVDIADPAIKLAIEVDGRTHRLKKWKFLDRRKESVLRALGWSVLRFSNRQVMENLEGVVAEVERFMTSKSRVTTTTSPTGR
jgi:Protein of unknown function (DUF559)